MTHSEVCIVHERFTEFAGSEQVVAQLARLWPQAPVLAPIAVPDNLPPELAGRVSGTRLSSLVRHGDGYAHLLPALPLAMRRLPVHQPGVVIASHHAFASQVVYATDSPVIAYVHSPARWVWDPATRVGEAGGPVGAAGLRAFGAAFRPFDRRAAAKLAAIVANSRAVADRIERWWHQPSVVVHPPVDTAFYTPDQAVPREDFLLLAGRLVPYKKPTIAIEAARRAGRRLIVAGDGRMRAECERVAGPDTEFAGRVSDEELRSLFRRCAALLMPGVEDFGIVPVEAQACGAPVVATGSGGALDTVLPGVTGELVPAAAGSDRALTTEWADTLRNLKTDRYDSGKIRRHAELFSREHFGTKMREVVKRQLEGRPVNG